MVKYYNYNKYYYNTKMGIYIMQSFFKVDNNKAT